MCADASIQVATRMLRSAQVKTLGATKGAWAVVTGSTSGLGEEFARQLAAKGFNILLIGRSHEKLDRLKQEIEGRHQVEVRHYIIDLAAAEEDDFCRLDEFIAPLDVGMLVNSAGVAETKVEYFIDSEADRSAGLIRLNDAALVRVTRGIAPGMASRKRGLIVNIASGSGWFHAASKAFVHAFSVTLGHELRHHGVRVVSLNTFYVHTPISKFRRSAWMAPEAADYVRRTLAHLGRAGGAYGTLPHVSNPWPSHALQQFIIDLLPYAVALRLVERMQLRAREHLRQTQTKRQ